MKKVTRQEYKDAKELFEDSSGSERDYYYALISAYVHKLPHPDSQESQELAQQQIISRNRSINFNHKTCLPQ